MLRAFCKLISCYIIIIIICYAFVLCISGILMAVCVGIFILPSSLLAGCHPPTLLCACSFTLHCFFLLLLFHMYVCLRFVGFDSMHTYWFHTKKNINKYISVVMAVKVVVGDAAACCERRTWMEKYLIWITMLRCWTLIYRDAVNEAVLLLFFSASSL